MIEHYVRNRRKQTRMGDEGLIKIVFDLEPDVWHGSATETMWAEPVGRTQFRLKNSPFFVFDISAEDIVSAAALGDLWRYKAVTHRGGHSTYRIFAFKDAGGRFDDHWKSLSELGCSYEEGPVLAVDVPPRADIYKVYSLLEAGEQANVWEFEEGHCGHPLKK